MPIYEYHCTQCDHHLEQLQKISDPPLMICPECQASSLKKVISKTGFRLQGTGWYATDFKKSAQKPQPPSSDAPPTESPKSTETPCDHSTACRHKSTPPETKSQS